MKNHIQPIRKYFSIIAFYNSIDKLEIDIVEWRG